MQITKIALTAVIGAILALQMKQAHNEYSIYVIFAMGLLLLFYCFDGLLKVVELLQSIGTRLGQNEIYLKILVKVVGIAYVSEFSSNLCKDAGYQTLSTQVQMAGKLTILVCAVPIFQGLLDTLWEVIGL